MMTDDNRLTDAPSARRSRRRFLTHAVAGMAVAAAVATPAVHAQTPIKLKFQSTWPNRDIFHEFAQDYVKLVNEMTGGRVQVDLLPAGAIVAAFQLQDAVNTGILDGGHGVTAYWYGKNKAFSLFGTGPALGLEANEALGWVRYGGGQALYDELVRDILKLNVVGFLTGPMPTQPLGWFKKEVGKPEDLRNMKYRTVGLSADLFKDLGAAVTILPGGEVVPAIERGLIDGAEFNNPSSDLLLGFPDVAKVYIVQSYHQPAECFEIMFNRQKYESLPKEVQAILKYASDAASADMSWKAQDRYSKDLVIIRSRGVKIEKASREVLQAQLDAWSRLIDRLSGDAFFKKVLDSQLAWAKRVVGFRLDYQVDSQLAYDHFFKNG